VIPKNLSIYQLKITIQRKNERIRTLTQLIESQAQTIREQNAMLEVIEIKLEERQQEVM